MVPKNNERAIMSILSTILMPRLTIITPILGTITAIEKKSPHRVNFFTNLIGVKQIRMTGIRADEYIRKFLLISHYMKYCEASEYEKGNYYRRQTKECLPLYGTDLAISDC